MSSDKTRNYGPDIPMINRLAEARAQRIKAEEFLERLEDNEATRLRKKVNKAKREGNWKITAEKLSELPREYPNAGIPTYAKAKPSDIGEYLTNLEKPKALPPPDWTISADDLAKLPREASLSQIAKEALLNPSDISMARRRASAKTIVKKLAPFMRGAGKAGLGLAKAAVKASPLLWAADVMAAPLTTEAVSGMVDEEDKVRAWKGQEGLRRRDEARVAASAGVNPAQVRQKLQQLRQIKSKPGVEASRRKVLQMIAGVSENGLELDDLENIRQQLNASVNKDKALIHGDPSAQAGKVMRLAGSPFEGAIQGDPQHEALLGPASAVIPEKLSKNSQKLFKDYTYKVAQRDLGQMDPDKPINIHNWSETDKTLAKMSTFERAGVKFSEAEMDKMDLVRRKLDTVLEPVVTDLKNNIKASSYELPNRAAGGIIPLKTLPESVLNRLNIPTENFQKMYLREQELPFEVRAYLGLGQKKTRN